MKRAERERLLIDLWDRILVKEANGSFNCEVDHRGYIKKVPLSLIRSQLVNEMSVPLAIAQKAAHYIFKFLRENLFIETLHASDRGSPIIGFKILRRGRISPKPQIIAAKTPQLTKVELEKTLTDVATGVMNQVFGRQLERMRELVLPRARGKPNIVVLFDTANFSIGCDKIGVKMPLRQIFKQIATIGNVIGSFAFYNHGHCPEYIFKVFSNYDCFLIACMDNKKNNDRQEKKLVEELSNQQPIQKDWIDPWLERFLRCFLPNLDFDIAVVASADKHFDPIANRIRQYGRRVIGCFADQDRKYVYLHGDDFPVLIIETERR